MSLFAHLIRGIQYGRNRLSRVAPTSIRPGTLKIGHLQDLIKPTRLAHHNSIDSQIAGR